MKNMIQVFMFCIIGLIVRANNIQVTNVSVQPATNTIQFTVSWDNSWRSTILNNWDAAWVFLKYYDPQLLRWAQVNFTNTGNNIPAGFTASIPPDKLGVFLYRSGSGSGTSAITNVQLGIPAQQATGIYDIQVFAIEMVYVPQGSFFAGDGVSGSGVYSFDPGTPGFISAGQVTEIADPLCLVCGGYLFSLPSAFPKGYSAFYCMKYELSQGAYRDFLNTLTYNQQVNHVIAAPNSPIGTSAFMASMRSFIEIKTPGISGGAAAVYGCDADGDNIFDEPTDGEWIACGYLNWPDHAAYLTWAGLRPITELEYEKAARGILIPVAGEYAWGNANIANTQYVLTNASMASEIISNPATSPTGNANYSATVPASVNTGPVRNGIFATATSNRISSGGSFYGIMELSGNLEERVVTSANFEGWSFNDAVVGLANLDASGYALGVSGWPGSDGNTINGSSNAIGLILRGGSFFNFGPELRISNRTNLLLINDANTARSSTAGCRGGRSAP